MKKYKIIKKKYIKYDYNSPKTYEIYYIKKRWLFLWDYLRTATFSSKVLTFDNYEFAKNYVKEIIQLNKRGFKNENLF